MQQLEFGQNMDFNTSNVNVYHTSEKLCAALQSHFNTSNVNVYQKRAVSYACTICISIHLMLMFIV